MARAPTIRWDDHAKAWRSDVGEIGKNGRRKPRYFRGHPHTPQGRRDAEDAMLAYVRERDRDEAARTISLDNPPVWQVVDAYLEHSEATVDRRTFLTHAERLNTWMSRAPGATHDEDAKAWSDHRLARTLTPADLSRVVKAMMREHLSAHYVAGIARSVKACWAWAARRDEDRSPQRVVPEDVFRDVKLPRIPPAPERYIPPDRAEALLAWIERRAAGVNGLTGQFERLTALLFRVQYESGARPGELCRATWRDFDAEAGVITLRKHKTAGKVARPRRVPLPGELARRVLAARERDGAHPEFLFTHKRGKAAGGRGADDAKAGEPWTVGALGQKFLKLRRASGLDVRVVDGSGNVPEKNPECTLYDFRRTFASDADEAGISSGRTADAMGNSAAMVDGVYRTRQARAAVEVAEAVRAKRRGGSGGEAVE